MRPQAGMTLDWSLRAAVVVLALATVAFLIRGLWRDLVRPRGRVDAQSDIIALYHLVLAVGCGVSLAISGMAALASSGFVWIGTIPFLSSLLAAAAIRFVPATHGACGRLIAQLRQMG
jgi:hypothetical protein